LQVVSSTLTVWNLLLLKPADGLHDGVDEEHEAEKLSARMTKFIL